MKCKWCGKLIEGDSFIYIIINEFGKRTFPTVRCRDEHERCPY